MAVVAVEASALVREELSVMATAEEMAVVAVLEKQLEEQAKEGVEGRKKEGTAAAREVALVGTRIPLCPDGIGSTHSRSTPWSKRGKSRSGQGSKRSEAPAPAPARALRLARVVASAPETARSPARALVPARDHGHRGRQRLEVREGWPRAVAPALASGAMA